MASSLPTAHAARLFHRGGTAARLRYVSDRAPGIARVPRGSGFGYRAVDGAAVRDAETIARARALAIPPVWTSVWICPSPTGHIQADINAYLSDIAGHDFTAKDIRTWAGTVLAATTLQAMGTRANSRPRSASRRRWPRSRNGYGTHRLSAGSAISILRC